MVIDGVFVADGSRFSEIAVVVGIEMEPMFVSPSAGNAVWKENGWRTEEFMMTRGMP